MAREFSKTSYRQSVRELADSIDLTTLSFSTFSDLLNGLFQVRRFPAVGNTPNIAIIVVAYKLAQ